MFILGSVSSQRPPTLLLDAYSGAAAAYSVRKLTIAYVGSAIRVRRSNDNSEQDIGFINNGLDTTSLLSFVGVNDGFITTWYDQSGNTNNAVQATATSQPKIVTGGVISYSNSRPAIEFTATQSTFMTLSSVFSGTAGSRFFITRLKAFPNAPSKTAFPLDEIGSSGQSAYYPNSVDSQVSDDFASTTRKDAIYALNSTQVTSTHLNTTFSDSGLFQQYFNRVLRYTTNTNTVGYKASPGRIGSGLGFVTSYLDGFISEIVVYTSNQSSNRTGIESNIKNYFNTP